MLECLSDTAREEILRECANDPYGGLNPEGMVGRIVSTYDLNVEAMGHDKCVNFVSETYSFTVETVEEVIKN